MTKHFIFILILVSAFSCKKDQDKTDREIIEAYLAEKSLTAQSTPEGVYYLIENEGTGKRPTLSNDVTVHYQGYLTDGKKFDGTTTNPVTFPLSGVIRGWQIGIPLFKEGGKGTLLIPSSLGYGSNPPFGSGIPSNAVLIFEVELLRVE